MPKVTLYIRNEDWENWLAVEDKPQLIHDVLNRTYGPMVVIKPIPAPMPNVIHKQPFVPNPPDPNTGYPCCTRTTRCKHWVWDSDIAVWRNALTNKVRESI